MPLARLARAATASLLLVPGGVRGQDVELRGEIHGTRPPAGYFRQLREDPRSFRFSLEGAERLERMRAGMRAASGRGPSPGRLALQGLGPREEPVEGTFHFPLVLGLFSDNEDPPLFSRSEIQSEFFDGPNSLGQTIPEFYDEISGGRVDMAGRTFDWQQTGLTREEVTLGDAALVARRTGGIGAFIEAILEAVDSTGVDWSQFDQSGDGYVDVLTVIHPGGGAECDGATNRIWSHRWSLSRVTAGRLADGFRTSTPRPDGEGYIHIDDYTVQPLLACDGERISEIGTFAHELGHGFGLPDLYRTGRGRFIPGAGNWDLMGTGGWGCGGTTPERPCHMGAWTKSVMGWVTVEEVAAGTDETVVLGPVQRSPRRVLKLPARDGANEYLLLENRQRIDSDRTLPEPGLLVWQVDGDILDAFWRQNGVNNDPERQGVWLRQADGRNELTITTAGRGDSGDPFPGCIKPSPADYADPSVPCDVNREFHAGKPPVARSHLGTGFGATLTGIELVGEDVRFRLHSGLSTVTVEAERVGAPAMLPGFQLDGQERETPIVFHSAPFEQHEVVATPGIPVGPGTREPFSGWRDGASRVRTLTTGFTDTTLVALYGGKEFRLLVATNDPAGGIVPATFTTEPSPTIAEGDAFWFPPGTEVSVLAAARRGFAFRSWAGAGVDSLANPAALVVSGPVELTANFDLVFRVASLPPRFEIRATTPTEIVLEVREGNSPVEWRLEEGRLPEGLVLASDDGIIRGAATETGEFQSTLAAVDAIGLEARALVRIGVTAPLIPVDVLVSSFVGPEDGVTASEKAFLDAAGNADGGYDIGDFRAYLLSSPGLSGANAAAASPRGEEGGGAAPSRGER